MGQQGGGLGGQIVRGHIGLYELFGFYSEEKLDSCWALNRDADMTCLCFNLVSLAAILRTDCRVAKSGRRETSWEDSLH